MVDDKPDDTSRSSDREPGHSSGAEEVRATRKSRTPPTIDLEASRVETPGEPHPNDASNEFPNRLRDGSRGIAVAALSGAAAAILIGCAAWLPGLLGGSQPLDVPTIATLETLHARLARLEEPPAVKPDSKSDTSTRLDAIEKSANQSLASLRDELSTVRAKGDRTASTVDGFKSASQPAATPDVAVMQEQIAQLDTKMQAMATENALLKEAQTQAQSQAAQIKAASVDDVKLKRAVAAASLDITVRQGEPFAAVLTAARQFSDDAAVLKPLEGFAATGVPGDAALSRELLALLPQLEAKPDATAYSGWFERLRASAARLSKIERADTASGSDTAAIVARAAAAARRNDVMEASRELKALPPADRAKVQPWIDKAAARDAALVASRQLAANAMTALAK